MNHREEMPEKVVSLDAPGTSRIIPTTSDGSPVEMTTEIHLETVGETMVHTADTHHITSETNRTEEIFTKDRVKQPQTTRG